MTDTQIAIIIIVLAAIAYWFFIHRKLQKKNQLLVTACAYILIIIFAWTSDNSWKLALLKTIVFGAMAVFNIYELINLRKKNFVVEGNEIIDKK